MQYEKVLAKLKALSNPDAVAGMTRFGINPKHTYGISIPNLQKIAKEIGKDHSLAGRLWSSGIHEARILACMIDEPEQVTEKQAEQWVKDFDSWDVCDQCCNRLFDKTPFAWRKAEEWSSRKEEFVKRAGFVLMTQLAVHDKKAADERFEHFFHIIVRESVDSRNFVKKAVNWALRQIGKRNRNLNILAAEAAREILQKDSKTARWIASDALRELTGEKVQNKLRNVSYRED
ncbi:MAG: DNA alkylation repair protein [Desulfobacteraceae bacterium IS3]|nr:MAG: DNA alkylation repair protein [Desulfobacteraceae bacterium IS3]